MEFPFASPATCLNMFLAEISTNRERKPEMELEIPSVSLCISNCENGPTSVLALCVFHFRARVSERGD